MPSISATSPTSPLRQLNKADGDLFAKKSTERLANAKMAPAATPQDLAIELHQLLVAAEKQMLEAETKPAAEEKPAEPKKVEANKPEPARKPEIKKKKKPLEDSLWERAMAAGFNMKV